MNGLNLYLLRYGELGTKSSRIKKDFKNIMIQNIERIFLYRDKEVIVDGRPHGRIFAYTDKDESHLFSRIFGIVSYSECEEIDPITSALEKIKKEARKFARESSGTFAARVKRVGEHDFTSQDVEEELGEVILDENSDLVVDLDDPDERFQVEIRNKRAYIVKDIKNAPGGLPLSSQGKVAAYIRDKYDFIATWLMMKRGARPYVYYGNSGWAERVEKWDPNLRKEEVSDFDDLLDKDLPDEIEALVLGERLSDFSKRKIDKLTLRPLIGLTEERIQDIYSSINELEKR